MEKLRWVAAFLAASTVVVLLLHASYVFALSPPRFLHVPHSWSANGKTIYVFFELLGIIAVLAAACVITLSLAKQKRDQEYRIYSMVLGLTGLGGVVGFVTLFYPTIERAIGCTFGGECPSANAIAESVTALPDWWWIHAWVTFALFAAITLWVFVIQAKGHLPDRRSILEPEFFSRLRNSSADDPALVIGASHPEWQKFGTGNARLAKRKLLWTKLGSPLVRNDAKPNDPFADDKMSAYFEATEEQRRKIDRDLRMRLYRRYVLPPSASRPLPPADGLEAVLQKVLGRNLAQLCRSNWFKSRVHRRFGMSDPDRAFARATCRWREVGYERKRDKSRVLFMSSQAEIEEFCDALDGKAHHYTSIRARGFQEAAKNKDGKIYWACKTDVLRVLRDRNPKAADTLASFQEWNFALAVRDSEETSAAAKPTEHGVVYFSPHPLSVSGAIDEPFPVTVYPAACRYESDDIKLYKGIDAFEYLNDQIRAQLIILRHILAQTDHQAKETLVEDIKQLRARCAACTHTDCKARPAATGAAGASAAAP